MKLVHLLVIFTLAIAAAPSAAEEASLDFGGDHYAAGQQAGVAAAVARDAFIAGYNVAISAPVEGDGHIAGFSVGTTARVAGDLYAAGYSVNVAGAVGGDVTAMGNSVLIGAAAPVGGNVRAAGQTVTLEGPISGSLLVTAQNLVLDTTVAGDVTFIGESIAFSPGARIAGTVSIRASREIAVPPEVAAADRVSFAQLANPDYVGQAGRTAESVISGFWPALWSALLWLAFLLVVGAAVIALLPSRLRALEAASALRPFRCFGLGILAFASTLGLVPVAALTIIGLVTLPFVLLYIFVACSLAYLAGAYLIALRVGGAFVTTDTNLTRLVLLALGLAAAVLLGLVPVVGWLLTLGITIFGFGAFAVVTMVRWSAADAGRIPAPGRPAAVAPTPST
jgi:cytoskeletal protein CcmA (bactofilin family)